LNHTSGLNLFFKWAEDSPKRILMAKKKKKEGDQPYLVTKKIQIAGLWCLVAGFEP
jgi:hypothetical protein